MSATMTRQDSKQAMVGLVDVGTLADGDLIERIQHGCDSSLEELLKRYRPMVRARTTRYYLQGAERSDVTQEGMIGLYKAIIAFVPQRGHEFAAFAQRCIQHEILSAVRRAARGKHTPLNTATPLSDPHGAAAPIAGSDGDPEAQAIAGAAVEAIHRWCATHLSEVEYAVLQAHLDGLSYAAMSARTGLSAKGVDNAMQRVRRKLQRHLAAVETAAA